MGTRDQYATIAAVMQAFAEENVWKQSELAAHVGVGVPALRKVLKSLEAGGMPLESEPDHPHVMWSVEKGWFPGGVIFDGKDWDVLVHAVLRLPDGSKRERLLRRLLSGRTSRRSAPDVDRLKGAVDATPVRPEEHEKQLLVEKALLEGKPLKVHYYSASTGRLAWRTLSPQKLFPEEPNRLVAFCHTHRELRWFRLDNMQRGDLEREQPRVDVPAAEVDSFVHRSVDGFHDGSAEDLSFRVDDPAAAWVRQNLLPGMRAEQLADGIRVTAHGAALVVARFIASLGGDGIAEGEPLRALVRQLAEQAAKANGP